MGRLIAGLFLLLFAFYALTGPGYSISGDGSFLLLSARNLLRTGSSSVPAIPDTELSRRRGVDGREYAKFAPGLVFAHLPMLLAVQHLELLRPTVGGRPVRALERDAFYAPFTNAWLMAATVSGMALCGVALGFAVNACVALAGLLAVASPLWLYARIDSSEALQGAALIGAAYFLLRNRDAIGGRSALTAGTLLGVAVAAKLVNVIIVPWFVLYAAWKAHRGAGRVASLLLAPLLVTLALIAIFNQARFGTPTGTGYELEPAAFDHAIVDGAWVQLFSLGHGLLVFCPAFALLPWVAREFGRRFPAEALLVGAVSLSVLAVYSKWWAYWGMSWGPRFLVPTLPLLGLVLLPLTERGRWTRLSLVVLSLAGIAVQGVAVASSYWGQVVPVWQRLELGGVPRGAAAADLRRWDLLVHLTPVSPLRVGLWWLENAACRDPLGSKPELTSPPWSARFPWIDAQSDPAVLADLPGLDLWAVPECWRRPYTSLWSKQPTPIPSNPRVLWLLLCIGVLGACLMASGGSRSPRGPGGDSSA
jgi:hypothetical protein